MGSISPPCDTKFTARTIAPEQHKREVRKDGGQGRIRTFVPRKEGQIYSLLPLTTRPPVRKSGRALIRCAEACKRVTEGQYNTTEPQYARSRTLKVAPPRYALLRQRPQARRYPVCFRPAGSSSSEDNVLPHWRTRGDTGGYGPGAAGVGGRSSARQSHVLPQDTTRVVITGRSVAGVRFDCEDRRSGGRDKEAVSSLRRRRQVGSTPNATGGSESHGSRTLHVRRLELRARRLARSRRLARASD